MDNLYRKGNQIEQEEKDLNTSLRLSALDNLDHYEILRHRIRLQAWNNFIYEPIFNISTIILNIQKKYQFSYTNECRLFFFALRDV